MSQKPVPLAGLTAIELSRGIAAAYAGRLLAMLGADVIRVETPVDGPGVHRILHAQKRSVAFDITVPAGRALLDRLVGTADVLIDDGVLGRPPGVLATYEELRATHPGLVVLAISPFGLEGPRAGHLATELTELASAAWVYGGTAVDPPVMPGSPVLQHGMGSLGAAGVMLALIARSRFGSGQIVEVTANEGGLMFQPFPTMFASFTGADMPRMGDSYPFGIYACADGHLGVSILTQRHWTGLCELMGRHDLMTDPRFASGVDRAQPGRAVEISAIIAEWIRTQPAQETFDRAQALRVPVAIIPSPLQVLASAQYAARNFWAEYDDPELGRLRVPGEPFKMINAGYAPFRPPAAPGADTANVFAERGIAHQEARS